MSLLGSVGSLYMLILIALLVVGFGLIGLWLVRYMFGTNETKDNKKNNNKQKNGGLIFMNSWLRLALFSFVAILISMAVLSFVSPGGFMGANTMNANMTYGNMSMYNGVRGVGVVNTPYGSMQMTGNMPMNMGTATMPMNQSMNGMGMMNTMPMSSSSGSGMGMMNMMPMNSSGSGMGMMNMMPMGSSQMQSNMPMNNATMTTMPMNNNMNMMQMINNMQMQLNQMQQQMMQMQQMPMGGGSSGGSSGGGMGMM